MLVQTNEKIKKKKVQWGIRIRIRRKQQINIRIPPRTSDISIHTVPILETDKCSLVTFYFLILLVLLLFYGLMFHFKLIRRKECWNTCVLPVNLANFVPSCYCPRCFRYFPWCWLFSFFSSNIFQMTLLKLTRVTASSVTLCYIIVNLYCLLLK